MSNNKFQETINDAALHNHSLSLLNDKGKKRRKTEKERKETAGGLVSSKNLPLIPHQEKKEEKETTRT